MPNTRAVTRRFERTNERGGEELAGESSRMIFCLPSVRCVTLGIFRRGIRSQFKH